MGNTHCALHSHVVFSTKNRAPLITESIRSRLFEYLGGAVRGEGGVALAVGGVADHVHMLVSLGADKPIADLMRNIKSGSTRWMKQVEGGCSDFKWQVGYAAFSVSQSQINRVKRYIADQEEHHRTRSFNEELKALLKAHGVDFDERYL